MRQFVSGKINVSYRGLVQPMVLNTGEGLFVSSGNAEKLMGVGVPAAGGKKLTTALLIGTLVTAGVVIALQAFREEEGIASPSAP